MQQSIYYTKFALQFADMQITELVNIFNRQVGNRAGLACGPITIRLSLTSSSGVASVPLRFIMAALSALPIAFDMM